MLTPSIYPLESVKTQNINGRLSEMRRLQSLVDEVRDHRNPRTPISAS